jgi:hypothetical protein
MMKNLENYNNHIIALDLALKNTGYSVCDMNFKFKEVGHIKTDQK